MRMKRYVIVALLLAWSGLWAQDVVRDSLKTAPATLPVDSIAVDEDDDNEENVIGARPSTYKRGEENILGAPVYYDADGKAIGSGEPTRRTVKRPLDTSNLHPVTIDNFNHFFVEIEGLFNRRSGALGLNFTYLPGRWGVYGSALFGRGRQYYSLGPALRLSGASARIDWQLYGGVMTTGRLFGGEAGMRVASMADDGRFSWLSASAGCAVVNRRAFVTVGVGLELSALFLLFIWW